MNKSVYIVCGIFLMLLLAGCGSDSEQEEVRKKPDKIERVGNGASTLGYDGEAIKKELRDMNQATEDRSNELDEVMGN